MSNAAELMKKISEVLAGYDRKVLDGLIASIPARREALAKARLDNKSISHQAFGYYGKLFEAVGGKGWYELLANGDGYISYRLTKTEAAKAAARNAKIAAKLDKAGISEITELESSHSTNGFTGRWSVETDKGVKHVFIDVILAGGYNIQCLHHRVLVTVR